jgi:hypothetical protein
MPRRTGGDAVDDLKSMQALYPEYLHDEEQVDRVAYQFDLTRRRFLKVLGAGLLIAVMDVSALGQDRRRRLRRGCTSDATGL